MATFSINQVTHLFAAVGNVGAASGNFLKEADVQNLGLGDMIIGNPNGVAPDKVNLWIAQKGHGGIVRSDLVKPSNICWIRKVAASAMQDTPKVLTVAFDSNVNSGNPIVGQDYILTFTMDTLLSPSQEDKTIVHAAARAFASDTATTLMSKIADSLKKSIERMYGEYIPVTVTDNQNGTMTITENFPYWEVGKFQYRRINFYANASTVTDQNTSMEVIWGTITESAGNTPFANGAKVADLEYFALGARGSEERNKCWPYNIETKGLISGTAGVENQNFDLLVIHYFYAGANTNNQKSERDLVIAGPAAKIEAVAEAVASVLQAAGVNPRSIVSVPAGGNSGGNPETH